MARIGLRRFRFGVLNENSTFDTCSYEEPKTLAGAIECKVSLDLAEAELYSDDILKEKMSLVKKGTITLGVDEDDDEIFAGLLGQTANKIVVGEEKDVTEYVSKSEDVPKAIGFGHIIPKIVSGTRKYKVEFFPKVTFKPFIVDSKTKGDSLEFTTPSVEGTVYCLKDSTWECHATFSTEENAQTYLDSLFKQM